MAGTLSVEAKRLWSYRWQIWLDMQKELLSDSRETIGRLFWVIALPLVPMGLYLFITTLRVFPAHDAIAGVPFVMVGAALWFLFSGLFLGPISAIKRKGKMAAQSRYPMLGVVASAVLQAWVEFAMRAAFAGFVLAFTQPPSFWGAIGLIGVIFPLSLLFLGAGIIVGVFSVAWKDLEKASTIIAQYLFFLSHVLFVLPKSAVPTWLAWCNPFAFAIDTGRWYLMFGEFLNVWTWLGMSVAGILMLVKAAHFLVVSEHRIAAHL